MVEYDAFDMQQYMWLYSSNDCYANLLRVMYGKDMNYKDYELEKHLKCSTLKETITNNFLYITIQWYNRVSCRGMLPSCAILYFEFKISKTGMAVSRL